MPYIRQSGRDDMLSGKRTADNAGDLSFGLTTLVHLYVEKHGLCYQTLNDVVGALEGTKAEFQRRVVAPYEDGKIAVNGDLKPGMTRWGRTP